MSAFFGAIRGNTVTDDNDAGRTHEDAILIDGQGVTVLLPVVQLPPEPVGGVDYIERAL